MKQYKLLALSIFSLMSVACAGTGSSNQASGSDAASQSIASQAGSPITVTVTGDLDIELDRELVGREATISFSSFPATLSQFEAVLPTLKQTPQGAVAAQLMAMELYRNNPSEGEKAFALCNVKNNVQMIMERVPDLLRNAGAASGDTGYARPYQVASFLEGATPANGYNPTLPYTVKVKVSQNGAIYSEVYQAKVLYLQVESSGTDLGYRGCEVINTLKPGEPQGWIVFNCPGLYTQCREIRFGQTFNGLK